MAGISVQDTKKAARRPLDNEVNLIPMIDLFICCTAFLLITAVWSHLSRMEASAQVPGDPNDVVEPRVPDRTLHVAINDPDKFTLVYKQGSTVVNTVSVPRRPVEIDDGTMRTVRYPDLAAAIEAEWKVNGSHRDPADRGVDQAVVHAANTVPYRDLVGVMDAVHATKRVRGTAAPASAFRISFAVD